MANAALGYDELFQKLKDDGYYGTITFQLQAGDVKILRFESTFKTVKDALRGKTTSE